MNISYPYDDKGRVRIMLSAREAIVLQRILGRLPYRKHIDLLFEIETDEEDKLLQALYEDLKIVSEEKS